MAIKKKTEIDVADELGVAPEELKRDPFADMDTVPIEIDMDFEAGGVQDYASGTYHARLEAVDKKTAKSGNSMLVWRFRTLQDRKAFWLNTVTTRDAMWKVTETAVACGATGEGKQRIDVSKLCNNLCRLVIEQQTYEGETRPSVKKVLAPTEATQDISDLG